ncbi:unnamed protein product, partial [Polarella glacialis]
EKILSELLQKKDAHQGAVTQLRQDHIALQKAKLAGDDLEFWRYSILTDWQTLQCAPESIRSDQDLVLDAVKRSGGPALRFAAESLRSDRDFVRKASNLSCGRALEHAAEEVSKDLLLLGQANKLRQLRSSMAVPMRPQALKEAKSPWETSKISLKSLGKR